MVEQMLKIFCVYYDARPIWRSDCIEPIQAGRTRTGWRLDMLGDDSGDNVSTENLRYGEMTAWYWVWKNYLPAHPELTHVGFSHYRRFLDFANDGTGGTRRMTYSRFRSVFERYYSQAHILDRIGDADLVMRTPERVEHRSLHDQFMSERPANIRDWDRMTELVRERHADCIAAVDAALNGGRLAMELQFVMRRQLFEDYMRWVFSLCREYESRWEWEGARDGGDARVPAFVMERMFVVWLAVKRLDGIKVMELPIVKLTGRDWRYYLIKPILTLLPKSVGGRIRGYFK